MKLILAIINSDDANSVSNALTDSGFHVTKLSTTGGFLKVGNTTFITGVDDDKVDAVIEIIKSTRYKTTKIIRNASALDIAFERGEAIFSAILVRF